MSAISTGSLGFAAMHEALFPGVVLQQLEMC
jgi:hypothetical protein